MENNEKKDFKKTGKILIICMIAAAVLCPILCDWNEVTSLSSSGKDIKLPTNTIWYHEEYPADYAFESLSSPDLGNIVTKYGKESVKIKGNKMYKVVGKEKYMGKIKLNSEGDIVIYNAADIVVTNGTYKRYNRLINY